jgi:histidyl-tRNA synthetase
MLPTGMIDLDEKQMEIRNRIFNIANKCFLARGSVQIETPAIEMFSTIKNLYGGDFNKQVFTLDGGETEEINDMDNKMLLRYDLTVPLCRYVSSNALRQFKRHQIGKVYRKDHAQISKGRFREFYQMDFDIVGNSDCHIYDIEIIDCICDVMNKLLGLENVIIKINHKCVVISLLNCANVQEEVRTSVCSILDRLDKVKFSEIEDELLTITSENSVQILKNIYNTFGINNFDQKSILLLNDVLKFDDATLENLMTLSQFKENLAKRLNSPILISFDPFLIRGMDYYTGILFEVGYTNKEIMPFTICAGGRYDNMIEKFNEIHTPAIGMSIGIERVARILEQTYFASRKPQNKYDIYVATISKTIDRAVTIEQMNICSELREYGYRVLTTHIKEQKFNRHFENVFKESIPFMVIIGDSELKSNTIAIKNITTKEQIVIPRANLISYFQDIFK